MPHKTVTIQTKIADSYEVQAQARQFNLIVDQPAPTGKDAAPTPLEYFFISLGACFCSIGKIIAEQRKIDLKSINVKIEGDINTDFILGLKTGGRAGFTDIRVHAEIDAPMSDEEKHEFINEIERRCPIADNIINESVVRVVS